MHNFAFAWILVLSYAVGTQQQGFKIPPGSRVELEIEIEPPPPGQMPTRSRQPPSPMMQQPAPMSQPQTSAIQQLLDNMVQTALRLRRMMGNRSPLPTMEEPCPCDVECCARPRDPRRVLPVMHIQMTMHRGCCGCVNCPLSMSPAISSMVLMAQRTDMSRPPAKAGGDAR